MMMSIKHDLAVETNIRIFEPQHIKAHHQFSPLQSSLNKVFIIKFLASTTKLQKSSLHEPHAVCHHYLLINLLGE
jgi:hypothetical protein